MMKLKAPFTKDNTAVLYNPTTKLYTHFPAGTEVQLVAGQKKEGDDCTVLLDGITYLVDRECLPGEGNVFNPQG